MQRIGCLRVNHFVKKNPLPVCINFRNAAAPAAHEPCFCKRKIEPCNAFNHLLRLVRMCSKSSCHFRADAQFFALLPCGKQSSFRFKRIPPLDRISAQFGVNPFALAPNFRKLRGCAVAHAKSHCAHSVRIDY